MIAKLLDSVHTKWLANALVILIGSCLIALAAPVSIRLPFSPVAFSLAPHICLALGAILGKERGSLAVLAYLFQGGMGLPVFALGNAGWLYFVGPTGGYLLGYLVATYLTGALIERVGRGSELKFFLSLAAGNMLIYVCGVSHLAQTIGWKPAVLFGCIPFLMTDGIKLIFLTWGFKGRWLKE